MTTSKKPIDPGQGKTVTKGGVCSLCGEPYHGYGHNPEPLKAYEERCCDACNADLVIPARIARLRRGEPQR